jgi:pimeloyl-ACP methyl ester carboxylesterase
MIAHQPGVVVMVSVRATSFTVEDQPSAFRFMSVDATRLRYLDTGAGTPVVLLHGNGSMIEDFASSGIMDAPGYRFIAFDRPGFGHSERPRGRDWGPTGQARLMRAALGRLRVERPIVVGHSWGSLVAMAMALDNPEDVAGLVLMSGYYYPLPRTDMGVTGAFPLTHVVLRHPLVRRMMAPGTLRRVFAPCEVPERFMRAYPMPLAMRASQMSTVDEEADMLIGATRELSRRYRQLSVPVRIVAGDEDLIVKTEWHSQRLHRELPASAFHRVPQCGHMVHHAAPEAVMAAVAAVGGAREGRTARHAVAGAKPLRRNWLHIGDSLAAA